MSTVHVKAAIVVALILAAMAIGTYCGYMIRDSMEAPESISAAPAVAQSDGSQLVERAPVTADQPPPKPPHKLPKRAKRERAIAATVQPAPPTADGKCKPVKIDLSLIRIDDGRRVVVSATDGTIIDAIDIPIERGMTPVERKWSAGVSYDPFGESPGAWIERDIGRFRIGADVYQDRAGTNLGMAARVRVGWTF